MFWKVFRLAPVSVAVYPIAFVLAKIAVLFAYALSPLIAGISIATGKNEVGGLLSYLYTHNASLDGGVEQGVEGYRDGLTGFSLWWQRVCWICRNPAYKFAAYVLGFSTDGATVIFDNGLIHRTAPYGYWSVVQSAGGWKWFGYRGRNCWYGWNYREYGGRHQVKGKPF